MPVYKRRNTSGKTVWFHKFQPPGASRNALPIREFGFATKQAAVDADVVRRTEEQKKYEMRKASVAAAMPTTLAMLLAEFMKQHAEENLAPKTVERYREMAACLAPDLLAMNMTEITPLHLSREWTRLLKCGGHTRKTKMDKTSERYVGDSLALKERAKEKKNMSRGAIRFGYRSALIVTRFSDYPAEPVPGSYFPHRRPGARLPAPRPCRT